MPEILDKSIASMWCENCEDTMKFIARLKKENKEAWDEVALLRGGRDKCCEDREQLKKELNDWRSKYAYSRNILERVQDLPGVRDALREQYKNEWRGVYDFPGGPK